MCSEKVGGDGVVSWVQGEASQLIEVRGAASFLVAHGFTHYDRGVTS